MTLYPLIRPLLFRLDPERAHILAMESIAACEAALATLGYAPAPRRDPLLAQRLWNLDFPNPVGLAAGFDKNGRAPHAWPLLGFGFAELGTITAQPQPGNDLPRMFRYEAERAVINRLGFNNAGAPAVAARLADLRARAPWPVPIGINIGKSRVVDVDDAVADYLDSFQRLRFFADYIVVNVSSPNTPGLRDLQDKARLQTLVDALMRENAGAGAKPLLVKVAPDLPEEALADIVAVARGSGVAGLVATNTTLDHKAITDGDQSGGLSGAPLRQRSTEVIRFLHRLAGGDLPIIGVGGISSAADAYEKIRAGASLLQLYTGLIYSGPMLPRAIVSGLANLLRRDGYNHISDAVGADVQKDMTGILIGLAVIAAVTAVYWPRFARQRAERREPGATVSLPIAVASFDEIDSHLEERRCQCGSRLALSGETSRQIRQRRYRIVRLLCPECEQEYQVYFDVTAVFH